MSAAGAGVVLATLATAMLTFLGVVFSIGLVALQLASQQFSPRVLRNYVRTTTTKVALGTFIATFIYPLFSLGYLDELTRRGHADISTVSVAVAMVLAVASIAVFIAYVTLTIRGMRIAYAISTVAVETSRGAGADVPARRALRRGRAAGPGRARPRDPLLLRPLRRWACTSVRGCCRRSTWRPACASRASTTASCVSPPGGPVRGQRRAAVRALRRARRPGLAAGRPDLLRTVDIGPERTVYRDPFYGVRALVDVAAQALSPAVNAPTTAVQVLDRLQDFLRQMAPRTWPSGLFADRDGTVRVVTQVRSWDQFVDLALTEITEFGAGSPQVTRRLAALLDSLKRSVPDERRPVLVRHQTLLSEAVAQRVASYRALAEIALEPDARGLGKNLGARAGRAAVQGAAPGCL